MLTNIIVAGVLWCSAAQDWPLTTAERTDYRQTSSYAEVMQFLDALQANGAPIRTYTIGKSTLGKDIPLVVCHQNPSITPFEAQRSGLPIVYVQANIHAGEVEGKEAVLRLLRELAQRRNDPLLSKTVLLFAPIYNIDGNDKFGPNKVNRGHQDGPDPVGERANGQGLDLNRDCMKAESPEFRAVLKHVWNGWGPDVLFDLHTTNGTRHGYVLTYSPGLNPTSDADVLRYTRDELLPKVRRQLKASHGYDLFDYGDAIGAGKEQRFSTFACEPRYVTNYASIRNRISILSEAASFQPFRLRVESTHAFVRACLDEIAKNGKRIVAMTQNADRRIVSAGLVAEDKAKSVGIRFDFDTRGREKVILEIERPAAEIDHMKAPTSFRTVEMAIVDRFKVTRTAMFPSAYIFGPEHEKVAVLAALHGLQVERLKLDWSGQVSVFAPSDRKIAGSPFQGHRLQSLEGVFRIEKGAAPAGSFLIRTSQPLGLVAFHLLEPESTDGVLAWGFLGEPFAKDVEYPIKKVLGPIVAVTSPYAVDSDP